MLRWSAIPGEELARLEDCRGWALARRRAYLRRRQNSGLRSKERAVRGSRARVAWRLRVQGFRGNLTAFKKEQGGALGAAHAAAVISDPHAGFGSIQLEGARF